MKEIAKNPPAAQDSKDNQKGSAKKKGDKGAEKAPAKEKPKRKGPLDTLPHNVEEWAVYDVPDEVGEFRPPDKSAYLKFILLFLNLNICCGYSKELS